MIPDALKLLAFSATLAWPHSREYRTYTVHVTATMNAATSGLDSPIVRWYLMSARNSKTRREADGSCYRVFASAGWLQRSG